MDESRNDYSDEQPPPLRPAAPPRVSGARHRRSKKGRGWMLLSFILAFFLLISLLGQFSGWLSQVGVGKVGSPRNPLGLEEMVIEDQPTENKIAVIECNGMISSAPLTRTGPGMVRLIQEKLELAGGDDRVRAVVLKVDSPGGEVLASDEISVAIEKFQNEHQKPVVASMGSLAASGGYYVSAPCRWIVANELTITGSVGVIMQGFNYRQLMDKVGVVPMVFKSGKYKNMLSGSKPLEEVTEEERAMVQAMVDQTFQRFKEVVREGRNASQAKNEGTGQSLAENWEKYADGRIWSGKQAFEWGFVDELGNFETAVNRAKTIAGISDANIIRYQPPVGFGSLFRLLGEQEPPSIKVDLGFELPKLHPGKTYFLWMPPF